MCAIRDLACFTDRNPIYWLVSVGYLEEKERGNGHKYKAPTELGTSIGITSVWKDGTQWQYLAVSYDANAQLFLLENLFK